MNAALDLEEAIDRGYGFDWGLTRDGRAVRVAAFGRTPVRFIISPAEGNSHLGNALDAALAEPPCADGVSDLSEWRQEGNVSVRHTESIEVRFTGVDEDLEIAVDAVIDAVLSTVRSS